LKQHERTYVKTLWIMIAGPYMSGSDGDPVKISANRARLESYCLPIYRRGHLPIIGEWLVHPIAHEAGGKADGDAVFNAYQYPVAQRLLHRCDAVLRIDGASKGADLDVATAQRLGMPVYMSVEEIPLLADAVGIVSAVASM
jgi:hypothetical protein